MVIREEDGDWNMKEGPHLQGYEHGVGFAGDTDDDGTLFDCFGGIFDLKNPALRRAGEIMRLDMSA